MARFSWLRPRMPQLVKKPDDAKIEDLSLKEFVNEGVKFMAKVSVNNPNYIPIPISEINFSLKFGSGEVIKGSIPNPGYSLKKKKRTILEVQMEVKYSEFRDIVKDIIANWDIDCHLELDLIIDIPALRKIAIPLQFDKKIEFDTQKLSQLWLEIKKMG